MTGFGAFRSFGNTGSKVSSAPKATVGRAEPAFYARVS